MVSLGCRCSHPWNEISQLILALSFLLGALYKTFHGLRSRGPAVTSSHAMPKLLRAPQIFPREHWAEDSRVRSLLLMICPPAETSIFLRSAWHPLVRVSFGGHPWLPLSNKRRKMKACTVWRRDKGMH